MTAVQDRSNGVSGMAQQWRSKNGETKAVGLPSAPRRQRNTTWLLVGALLIVGSGVAALSMASSLADRVEVVVANRDIAEGEVLAATDFDTIAVGMTSGAVAVDPADIPDLVGQVAAGPIGRGAIVHPDYFIGGSDATKSVIVGVDADPGEYPRAGMQPGDQMVLIELAEETFGELDRASREVGEGEVVEVIELSRADAFLVSLRIESSIASQIATLTAEDRISLALKDLADGDIGVVPVTPAQPAAPLTEDGGDAEAGSEGDAQAGTGPETEAGSGQDGGG